MMGIKGQISVVIPLYNKADFIVRAIQSVLEQGDAVAEIVVVDDGSSDDSVLRVQKIGDQKIRVIQQPNGGPSAARNRGIEESRCDFVAFLDADDVYLPGFIDEIVALNQRYPDASIYATSYTRVWPDGRRQDAYMPRGIVRGEQQIVKELFCAFSRSSIFSISSSACVRKKTLSDHGITFPVGEKVGEDQDVIFRLAEVGDVAFSAKFLVEYTKGISDSLYHTVPDYLPPCYLRLAHRRSLPTFPRSQRRGAARLLSVSYLNVVRTKIERGDKQKAMSLFFRPIAFFHWTYWLRTLLRLVLPAAWFKYGWMRRI